MEKKIISVLTLISVIAIGFWQKDILLELIKEGNALAMLISMLLVAICVFFPLVPFTVLGGMIGALFGVTKGVFISYSGAMAGTILFFFICRYGFRDWAQKMMMKYPKAQKFEKYIESNSFLFILTARLIPVIPAPVFNAACGLSKVDWKIFLLASAIGKIPNIVILTFAGANVTHNIWFSFTIYGSYLFIILALSFIIVQQKMPRDNPVKK